jgi:hypothetical protein
MVAVQGSDQGTDDGFGSGRDDHGGIYDTDEADSGQRGSSTGPRFREFSLSSARDHRALRLTPAPRLGVVETDDMTKTEATQNVYQPGVCNIGPSEIRSRRRTGYIGLALTAVFLVIAYAVGLAAPWRLFVFLPAVLAATGFLQAQLHFCTRFGAQGLFNFGELGTQESVMDAEFRRKDQRKAALIIVLSVVIGAAAALVVFLIP